MHHIQSVEYIPKVFIIKPPGLYLLQYKCHFNVAKRGNELGLLFTVESSVNLLPKVNIKDITHFALLCLPTAVNTSVSGLCI